MNTEGNVQIRLASRPDGLPTNETWSITSSPIPELTGDEEKFAPRFTIGFHTLF